MLSEKEAREILQERKVERDLTETRTCLEVVQDLGLVSLRPEIVVELPDLTEDIKV